MAMTDLYRFGARQSGEEVAAYVGSNRADGWQLILDAAARHAIAGPVTIYEGLDEKAKPILELRQPNESGPVQTIRFDQLMGEL